MKNILFIASIMLLLMNNQYLSQNPHQISYKTMNPYQYLITKETEKFDVIRYNQMKNEYDIYSDYTKKGNYFKMISAKSGSSYVEHIKDTYYSIVKTYYPNGNIHKKGLSFNQMTFKIGIWYEFDENGVFIKENNYDTDYLFTLEDVIKYCNSLNNIIKIKEDVFPKGEYIEFNPNSYNNIRKEIINQIPVWIIEYFDNDMEISKGERITRNGHTINATIINYKKIIIEGRTGKILTQEDIKRMKPSTPYRTHNGKSYTEAEWKTYEEAQSQEYFKKKNGKSFWDKLFGD